MAQWIKNDAPLAVLVALLILIEALLLFGAVILIWSIDRSIRWPWLLIVLSLTGIASSIAIQNDNRYKTTLYVTTLLLVTITLTYHHLL